MLGGGDKCSKCAKTVYATEKVVSLNRIWYGLMIQTGSGGDCIMILTSKY